MALSSRGLALIVAASLGAHGAVLYKSVSPQGTIEFSDQPPDRNKVVDRIQLKDDGSPYTVPPVAALGAANDPVVENDAAVARASAQLDMAEHALAIARQPFAATNDPMHLVARRPARPDIERIEYFKRGVVVARQNLMEVLKKSRAASQQTLTASAGDPIYRR
jgi:hypothetical protein